MKHTFVFKEPGRFGGWPANNGIWIWDNEIAVAFSNCTYLENDKGHSIDKGGTRCTMLARSLDGGETWTQEEKPEFGFDKAIELDDPIDFSRPGFAMRSWKDLFLYSYDRGKTWKGPFRFPEFYEGMEMTNRTDYLINSSDDCHVFLSGSNPQVQAGGYLDRAFCARLTKGGKKIRFLGWMTNEPFNVRSVMPATVRISETELVSIVRRRHDISAKGDFQFCWIEAVGSENNGQRWKTLSRVAMTDLGHRNGNPPSLVKLHDGRLVTAYGVRNLPFGMRAKISEDNGKTWSGEIHLRDDGRTWDIGYPRMVQRPDGKIVTIYYYTTEENREQHIAATIWDADEVTG